jgi:catechol 2,3-dioxygenase-like lactoylglutathione lyase family enzyme
MASHRSELRSVGIVVRDLAESVDFYRSAGLDIPEESIYKQDGVGLHVEVPMSNGSSLEIDAVAMTRRYDPSGPEPGAASPTVLMFTVPSRDAVDEMHAALVADGVKSHLDPFDAFWGARYAVVLDPDGNQVSFMSPMSEATSA